jgi:predicted 3-demethylubiquinone-9 3-methyltransferase (glyoxalase superfamily)
MASLQKITPHLWFDKEARQAAEFYASVFKEARINRIDTIKDTPSGDTDVVDMDILGMNFQFISAGPLFKFNESVSFIIHCEDQAEVDYYWEKLSAVPESEQCGWIKDRFGLSWQIVPNALGELMSSGDTEQSARVTQAMLKMKKLDVAELQRAYDGQ